MAFATVDVAGEGMKQRLGSALTTLGLGNDVHSPLTAEERDTARHHLRTMQGRDKQMVLLNVSHETSSAMMADTSFVVNREGRMKNINHANGDHLFSPRLRDGGLSMATSGAQALFERRAEALPATLPRTEWWGHSGQGPAVVIVDDDAEPFVRKGRNVFHGFALACDPWLAPGEPCLLANQAGEFLGHGVAQCTSTELATLSKGIAVKTRGSVRR